MKKGIIFSALFALLLATAFVDISPAMEGGFQDGSQVAGGGFSGPGLALSTVREALTMRDDTHVILRGNIMRHLGKDRYLFQDATGTVTVEIDHDKWGGQTITPGDAVELYGEIDRDLFNVEVEVDRVVKR